MLFENLLVAALLVAVTFTLHFAGLVGLMAMLRRLGGHPRRSSTVVKQGIAILTVVFGLFALHSLQIWIYAFAYLGVGELQQLETALYFSTVSFTTVGFGDVILSDDWRMLGAAEGANGFLLIGWSTAFLVSLTARVRAFEAEIEGIDDQAPGGP
ncbi:MAG: two pore domain potassium channel family protein [Hyphomonas sp.]|nr:two pore domain potassium channel family protein [Hyphomonas sp.]MBU3919023.1 potassium channel family protein [Alphaproteobacteria bacterium]MBU4063001.1 potassium channel family protein [Alphaproteobacteria bacterium]MBU4163582.1 potassium channel family protein [Alphaproteobacteria bacterium]MBU4568405.1 potassium channel family protein [Alphaproteobacteria bacterium]